MKYDYRTYLKALGARLRELRTERGWRQVDMVRDHGFHTSHYQSLERGDKMSMQTLLRLAEVFDIPVSDLLKPIDSAGKISERAAKTSEKKRPKGKKST